MPFLTAKMTFGGKLSLGYLVCATFLVITGGQSSDLFLMVLGSPLMHIPWAMRQLFAKPDWLPQWLPNLIGVVFWVGNAYLWGHTIAAGVWLIRPLIGNDDDEPAEGGGP